MRTLKMAVAAACLLSAAAGQAFALDVNAAPPREASSDKMAVGAVDFRDAAQVRAFHKDLQQAALFVCGVQADTTSKKQRDADKACAEAAVSQAVASLDRPLLTATYQQSGAPMVARGY